MKIKFFVIAAIAATTLFASCNRDNSANDEDSGRATQIKVSLNFPAAPQTRATTDPNATANEAAVNTVDIFIYNASGSFQSHTALTAADFTPAGQKGNADAYQYTASTKIPTTTGAKSVFAGINLPESVVNAIVNQPGSSLGTHVHTLTRAELASGSNFIMFSVEPVTSTFVDDHNDPANSVEVKCQRLVAKVTVETSNTLDASALPGILSNLMFAVNNFNTKLFMLQGAATLHKDPNWELDRYVIGDFNTATGADYANILSRAMIASPAIGDYTPRYAAENTTQGKRKKEITRVTVRAAFVPTNYWTGTAGNFTQSATIDNTPRTFYAFTPDVVSGTAFFFDLTVANAFAGARSAEVLTYTNGFCYWDIFLGKNNEPSENKWDVLRNDFYKCNITKIAALGRPYPEIPGEEEDNTPESETDISAEIQILFWNTPILSDYVLE